MSITTTQPTVEAIARAYFDSEPDGCPGSYDGSVSQLVKERTRPRFEAIAALFPGRPESVVWDEGYTAASVLHDYEIKAGCGCQIEGSA